jgi:hypothetical protein
LTDEKTVIGPHLLGRKPNTVDDRDWSAEKLHTFLKTTKAPIDDMLDKTVREVSTGLSTWKQVLAFAAALWKWIKHNPTPPPPKAFKIWNDDLILDQGNYGTCVGNAGAGFLRAEPIVDPKVDETLARALYYEATCNDGACDPTYNEGATSRGLAKALKARGRISAYAFAASLDEVNKWLDTYGPVMVGTDWTDDMMYPNSNGFVYFTGNIEGGHEWLILGRDSETVYYAANSWGTSWGDKGHFRINASDLNKLLFNQDGDALLAAELPL